MTSPDETPVDGTRASPPDDTQQDGILKIGLEDIWTKLQEIHSDMKLLPENTGKVLSKELQHGIEVKAGNNGLQDATETSNVMNDMMAVNQREMEQLDGRLQIANLALEASTTREDELKKELLDLRRDIARLEKKEVQFRDIIVKNAATQKITDQEVIQGFSELRQTVQQLAKSQIFDLAQDLLTPHRKVNQANKHFYTTIRGLSPKDINFRVRMRIWEILHKHILGHTIFGLKRTKPHDDMTLWNIEDNLAILEEYWKRDKVSDNMIADWRVCTLQCIDAMRITEQHSTYVSDEMMNCFGPLISKTATELQKDGLWDKMANVCSKAVALKMMMQRSKEGYNIISINLKNNSLYSQVTHWTESMGVEGGKTPDASDDIAYVLFGALAKHPMNNPQDNRVLLKAEVILKKNSRR